VEDACAPRRGERGAKAARSRVCNRDQRTAREADRAARVVIEHAADPRDLGKVIAAADRAERALEAVAERRGVGARRQPLADRFARGEPAQVVGDTVELGQSARAAVPYRIEQRAWIDRAEQGRLEGGAQPALEA